MQSFPANMPTGQDDIEQNDPVYLEDFENDDLIFFRSDFGFAINIKTQSFLLFQRINGDWYDDKLPLSDLRNATETALEAGEYYSENQFRGARGIGQSIGIALRNSMEKSNARNGTGITLHFRSIERPTFFLNITDANERSSLMEALRQVLADGKMRTPYRVMSHEIEDIFRRPTKEHIVKTEKAEMRTGLRKSHTSIGFNGYLGILIFAACATFPIWYAIREYSFQVNGYYSKVLTVDFVVYFVIAAIGARIALGIYKTVKFWIWEAKQGTV